MEIRLSMYMSPGDHEHVLFDVVICSDRRIMYSSPRCRSAPLTSTVNWRTQLPKATICALRSPKTALGRHSGRVLHGR